MNIIKNGKTYQVYDDGLVVLNELPVQAYTVEFNKMTGFYLTKVNTFEIKEKLYGNHEQKCEKVMKAFNIFERNLGVILSGNKGIGKSLFAKLLSNKAIENGYPLIIVDHYIPGIAGFIESIEQKVVVMFDEFDKTFGMKVPDGAEDPQASMLSLFDGFTNGKKMFVITCNELHKLNDYLVNRPGRFHYHFRFNYPNPEEIREYLQDKIDKQYWNEIQNVITFSKKVDLNYDCLRAIAFELNLGSTFKDAVKDLNIINLSREKYNLKLSCSSPDGNIIFTSTEAYIDLFTSEEESFWVTGPKFGCYIKFNPNKASMDLCSNNLIIQPADITIEADSYDNDDVKNKVNDLVPELLILERKVSQKMMHYVV